MSVRDAIAKFTMPRTSVSKRGMWHGWTMAQLKAELNKVKQQMAAAKGEVPHELRTRFSQLTFALRAKQKGSKHWGRISRANLMALATDSHLLINSALLIRMLEWARETSNDDDAVHTLVEKMMQLNETSKHGEEFTMDDVNTLGIAG